MDSPVSVLVVEDHADSRAMLIEMLSHVGMHASGCETIAEAVAAVRARVPDAVVLDLALRGERGLDLARSLRAAADTEHVAIIAVTGAVEPTLDVVRHVDAYLRKPIALRALPGLVRTLVRAASEARSPTRRGRGR